MSDVTRILQSIEDGDSKAADELLPLVYGELRKLAAARMAQENPGQTLQATALVHEAYLRLVTGGETDQEQNWDGRAHFFAAAAEAMRRILVEQARRRRTLKHGGELQRVDIENAQVALEPPPDDVLALDQALEKLTDEDLLAAQVAKLRLFAGLTLDEAANGLRISRTTAYRQWTFARAWLRAELRDDDDTEGK